MKIFKYQMKLLQKMTSRVRKRMEQRRNKKNSNKEYIAIIGRGFGEKAVNNYSTLKLKKKIILTLVTAPTNKF
ncbi:hypothetical protein C0J52_26236 [Blattella germanica]|nr:hypothetical protein C0J52_26236 [Blattella germanica]